MWCSRSMSRPGIWTGSGDRFDRKLVQDYEDLKADGISQYAELRIIKFPAKYIGNRDRPYLQDIIQTLLEEQKEGNTGKAAAAN